MASPNPLPLLVDHCAIKLPTIQLALGYKRMHIATLHRLVRATQLKDRNHSRLFDLTMTEWGQCDEPDIKQLLWDCYFPGDRPHVLHLLFYQFQIPMATLMTKSGLTERVIRRWLHRPKLQRHVLRAIGPFAIEYRDALASKKQRGGPDPRYMLLHRAITDTSRLYDRGDVIED